MNNQFNEINKNMYNNFGNSFQKLIELNLKTAKDISYVNPMELLSPEPQVIIKKPIETFIHNSLILNNYLNETFNILTNQWLKIAPTIPEKTKKIVEQASSFMDENIQNTIKLSRKTNPVKNKIDVKKDKTESIKIVKSKGKEKSQAASSKLQSNIVPVKPKDQKLSAQKGAGSLNKNNKKGTTANKSMPKAKSNLKDKI